MKCWRFSLIVAPLSGGPPPATTRTGLPQVWASMQKKVCLDMAPPGLRQGYWKRSMAKGCKMRIGHADDQRGDVAGGRRRQRQPEMAVAEGEEDARGRAGRGRSPASESGVDGRHPIHSLPPASGRSGT